MPTLGDLPPAVLLKIAGGCEVVEDILALRASCRGARAALDAWAWRQLIIARFGAAAANGDGDDLETEMSTYERLESPAVYGLEGQGQARTDKVTYHEYNGPWPLDYDLQVLRVDCRFFRSVDWRFSLKIEFRAVPPGTYVLQAHACPGRPHLPFAVELSWKDAPQQSDSEQSASEGYWIFVGRQLTLELNPDPFTRESFPLRGQADWPFTVPALRWQRTCAITCLLEASQEDMWMAEGERLVEFCTLRLRRVRAQQPEEEMESLKGLTSFMKAVLGDKVARVASSSRLTDVPCALMVPQFGWSPAQALGEKYTAEYEERHEVLQLNPGHPLITALNKLWRADEERAKAITVMLYESSLVAGGDSVDSPKAFASRIFTLIGPAAGVGEASA